MRMIFRAVRFLLSTSAFSRKNRCFNGRKVFSWAEQVLVFDGLFIFLIHIRLELNSTETFWVRGMDEELIFHPVTGKLVIHRDTAGSSDDDNDDDGVDCASFISVSDDRSALVSKPNPAYPTYANLPSFSVKTIHISCKSDAYRGSKYCYAGVIIYSCDGKSHWQTANGTRCKSGYLVIMDTETGKFKKYKQQSPGQVHGAVYRSAFGEECTARNVNAEGFSVMNGVFKINSGVFNPAKDGYHDDKKSMHPPSASCIQRVVNSWMNAREHFYENRNFMIKDLQ